MLMDPNPTFMRIPHMTHAVDKEEMQAVKQFLHSVYDNNNDNNNDNDNKSS